MLPFRMRSFLRIETGRVIWPFELTVATSTMALCKVFLTLKGCLSGPVVGRVGIQQLRPASNQGVSEGLGALVHVYAYMARKAISITREAYDRLRARKGRDESFTDVILRLTERKPLADSAGMLSKSSVKAIRSAIDGAQRERRALDVRT